MSVSSDRLPGARYSRWYMPCGKYQMTSHFYKIRFILKMILIGCTHDDASSINDSASSRCSSRKKPSLYWYWRRPSLLPITGDKGPVSNLASIIHYRVSAWHHRGDILHDSHKSGVVARMPIKASRPYTFTSFRLKNFASTLWWSHQISTFEGFSGEESIAIVAFDDFALYEMGKHGALFGQLIVEMMRRIMK